MGRIFSQRIRNILEKDSLTLSYWFEDTIEILMSENKESKFLRVAYYAIPILLVAYVMSIGPAIAIITDSNWNTVSPEYVGLVEVLYAPLGWVANTNETLKTLASAYIDFFVQRF